MESSKRKAEATGDDTDTVHADKKSRQSDVSSTVISISEYDIDIDRVVKELNGMAISDILLFMDTTWRIRVYVSSSRTASVKRQIGTLIVARDAHHSVMVGGLQYFARLQDYRPNLWYYDPDNDGLRGNRVLFDPTYITRESFIAAVAPWVQHQRDHDRNRRIRSVATDQLHESNHPLCVDGVRDIVLEYISSLKYDSALCPAHLDLIEND